MESEICSSCEECIDTLEVLFAFPDTFGNSWLYLSETIRGYIERNGIDLLNFLKSVESFAQDGLFLSMSTTYYSMLGVYSLQSLSSMCFSSRFQIYVSCKSWVTWSIRCFLCVVTVIVHGIVTYLLMWIVLCVNRKASNFCSISELCTLLFNCVS